MERTARVIIYNDGEIPNTLNLKEGYLFIKRVKKSNTYYTFPGGHVEEGETFEVAAIREVEEELNIKVEIKDIAIKLYNKDIDRDEIFYNVVYKDGKLMYGNGPEFTNPDAEKYGTYEIVSVAKEEIDNLNILPKEVKEYLQK